jgi:hypothetical protein
MLPAGFDLSSSIVAATGPVAFCDVVRVIGAACVLAAGGGSR